MCVIFVQSVSVCRDSTNVQKKVSRGQIQSARLTFEQVALGDKGEVGEPALQTVKDVGGIHDHSAPHLTLLPAIIAS